MKKVLPTITAFIGFGLMTGACGGIDAGEGLLTMTLFMLAGLILFCISVLWLQVLSIKERKKRYGSSQDYESKEVRRIQEVHSSQGRRKAVPGQRRLEIPDNLYRESNRIRLQVCLDRKASQRTYELSSK